MPRNPTTGVFTRVVNSFSDPVLGDVIDPTDADATFNDYDDGITDSVAPPVSSTDNAIARFDGTTGKFIQSSGAHIEDNGTLVLAGGALPQIQFTPTSGATKIGQIFQQADTLIVASAGVENKLAFSLASRGGITSTVPFSITPTANLGEKALSVAQSGPYSGVQSDPYNFNEILINGEAANVDNSPNAYANGLQVRMLTGGANKQGSRAAVWSELYVNGAPNVSALNGDDIATVTQAKSSVNVGGTNTGAGAKGSIFAFAPLAWLQAGATNYFSVAGAEIDITIDPAASSRNRFALDLSSSGGIQGAVVDAAISIRGQGDTGWKQGIQFGALEVGSGGQPVDATTGVLFGSDSYSYTAASFAEFPNWTFSGYLFNFPHFQVTGAGAITATGVTATNPSTNAYLALSGASNLFTSYGLGRTANEANLGVAGNANNFFTGTVAGDIALTTAGGTLWLGTGNTLPSIKMLAGATTFPQLATAGVLTTDATGLLATNATLPAGRFPALTGDITTVAGAVGTVLSTVNPNVGTFGSATQSVQFTVNAKGLVTAAANVTVTPAVGNITGLGTGVATFLATPSSATLASALTDETGSGALVFGTAPTIAGGAHTGITSLGIRDTSAAFDVTLAAVSSTALTAGRTLTLDMVNAARTIKLQGNIDLGGTLTTAAAFTTSGANALTLTTTGSTNVTLPTSGTLAALGGTNTWTGKQTISGLSNDAVLVLSGGSTINAGFGVGRTVVEGYFVVIGTATQYAPNTAQGDVLVRGKTNLLLTGGDGAANAIIVDSTNALTLPIDRGLLFTNQTSGAAAQVGTLTNAPAAGNPGHWLKIKVGGTSYCIPCWAG